MNSWIASVTRLRSLAFLWNSCMANPKIPPHQPFLVALRGFLPCGMPKCFYLWQTITQVQLLRPPAEQPKPKGERGAPRAPSSPPPPPNSTNTHPLRRCPPSHACRRFLLHRKGIPNLHYNHHSSALVRNWKCHLFNVTVIWKASSHCLSFFAPPYQGIIIFVVITRVACRENTRKEKARRKIWWRLGKLGKI